MDIITLRNDEEERRRDIEFTAAAALTTQQYPPRRTRRTVAAILAGGSGSRLGADRPKQLLEAGGKSLLEHAVEAFQRSARIDEICLVAGRATLGAARALKASGRYPKIGPVVEGGAERSDSSRAALEAYAGQDLHILIHDAARPLVGAALIGRVADALEAGADGVCPVLEATDTLLETDAGGRPLLQPDRRRLRRVQTPQGFRLAAIAEAYRLAAADPAFRATDDFGVALRYLPQARLTTVEGEEHCFKVTYPDDLGRLDALVGTTRRP